MTKWLTWLNQFVHLQDIELKITLVSQYYLERKQLDVEKIGLGHAWSYAGTCAALMEGAQFVYSIKQR
jgi:glucose-1-phosphate thymidylyltransferase